MFSRVLTLVLLELNLTLIITFYKKNCEVHSFTVDENHITKLLNSISNKNIFLSVIIELKAAKLLLEIVALLHSQEG